MTLATYHLEVKLVTFNFWNQMVCWQENHIYNWVKSLSTANSGRQSFNANPLNTELCCWKYKYNKVNGSRLNRILTEECLQFILEAVPDGEDINMKFSFDFSYEIC